MALEPLASSSDLSALGVDTSDVALTEFALAAASESVRDAAGGPISQKVSTFTISGARSQWLDLPISPVGEVTTVAIDGHPVTDYKVIDGTLWRRGYWAGCGEPSTVEITATHGYLDVPADIMLLVAQLAAAVINAAAEGMESRIGVQSEGVDDYTVSFVTGSEAVASAVELPERTRSSLRRRFGGGAVVTDVRQ